MYQEPAHCVDTPTDWDLSPHRGRTGQSELSSLPGPAPRQTLTIIIPCYNERDTILNLLQRVRRLPIDKSILVIDNASTDGTTELLRSMCSEEGAVECGRLCNSSVGSSARQLEGDGFTLILQPVNRGKGTSIRLGVALATGKYLICQDADLEYDPGDIVQLLEHAERTGAAAVFGSRLLGRRWVDFGAFQVGRTVLTACFRILYRSKVTDVATCYKLMRTEVARSLHLEASGFDLDFEIPAKLEKLRWTIEERAVSYRPRGRDQGKKIRWYDGLTALWTLCRIRLG